MFRRSLALYNYVPFSHFPSLRAYSLWNVQPLEHTGFGAHSRHRDITADLKCKESSRINSHALLAWLSCWRAGMCVGGWVRGGGMNSAIYPHARNNVQPIHTARHATYPHRTTCNLSTQNDMQPIHTALHAAYRTE